MKKIYKKILVVWGSGGHSLQVSKLLHLLGNRYQYFHMIRSEDPIGNKQVTAPGKIFKFHETRAFHDNIFVTLLKVIRTIIESFLILQKTQPDAIISAGAGPAVPVSILGRLQGKKIIFLESWSRVNNPSESGKLIYPFSSLFFVQWPELKKKYPKAIYAGRLM